MSLGPQPWESGPEFDREVARRLALGRGFSDWDAWWSGDHDTYSWHEAMDRAHTLTRSVSEQLCEHPVISGDPELFKLAVAAEDALASLYQATSSKAPHMKAAVQTCMDAIDRALEAKP